MHVLNEHENFQNFLQFVRVSDLPNSSKKNKKKAIQIVNIDK